MEEGEAQIDARGNPQRTNDEGPGLQQQIAVRGFPGKLFAGMPEQLLEWLLAC